MHLPGLAATKIARCLPLYLVGCFVIAPNMQPAHLGGLTLENYLGILPFLAKILRFLNERAKTVMLSHQLGLVIIGLHVIILFICIGERALGRIGESANFVC